MTLDDEILRIMQLGGGTIAIVDDLCDDDSPSNRVLYSEHIENEDDCEDFAREHGIRIIDIGHRKVQEGSRTYEDAFLNPGNLLIMVNANLSVPAMRIAELLPSAASVKKLKEDFPQARLIYYIPKSKALRQVCSLLLPPEVDGIIDELDIERFPTLMHLLNHRLTGRVRGKGGRSLSSIQHECRNVMWEQYLPFIDRSLRAGNSQSGMDFSFLILSDREKILLGEYAQCGRGKVKVEGLDYIPQEQDLANCAAIFIDNKWIGRGAALGKGIDTLRKVRERLDEIGVRIPIIYQSGHRLEEFSVDEQAEIRGLGAVLATKDFFPKVCRGKEQAEKEMEMARIIQQNSHLARYSAKIYDFNGGELLGKDDLFVVCSRIVDGKPEADVRKQEIFTKLDLEDNGLNHKMYVLAMFHATLKDEVNNPVLSRPITSYFRDYQAVKEGLSSRESFQRIDCKAIEELYESIRAIHEEELTRPTTITHNDTKWDNWFGGKVLGDFGDVCAGTEYKDLARALLDKDTEFEKVKDFKYVEQAVKSYLSLRAELDGFKCQENFVQKVKELVFVESLRLARYKAGKGDPENVVDTLISVAQTYSQHLHR